jgi:hypothetical protein
MEGLALLDDLAGRVMLHVVREKGVGGAERRESPDDDAKEQKIGTERKSRESRPDYLSLHLRRAKRYKPESERWMPIP